VAPILVIDLIFVAIDHPRRWVLSNRQCDKRKSVFGKYIVVIQESDPLASRNTQSAIRSCRNVPILLAPDDSDPTVAVLDFSEDVRYDRVTRVIVSET
jgi:hypothetical protein